MNRYVLYSVLFHITLLVLVFFIIHPKVSRKPAPFVATIITPEEMQAKTPRQAPPVKKPSQVPPVKEPTQSLRLPKNLPPPERLSAIPSSHAPTVKSRASSAARSPEAGASQRSTVEPTRDHEQGMAEEEHRTFLKGKENGNSSQAGQGVFSTRDKLLDRDILNTIARNTPDKSEDNGITFDTKEYKYYGYMQRLREKIESIWKYPAEAAQRRLNGELYIKFTIKKDGSLGAVELVHTSGYKVLDDGAISALRDADPYWPLPDSWKMESLTITGHFVYYFHNTYIR